jgi:Protein of unknown function (DUF4065)
MKITTPKQEPDDEKFRELILFICRESEGDEKFGATKLNKLLFYADFIAYTTLGKAITWHRYQKLGKGPAPRALKPILQKMESAREVAFAKRDYFGKVQHRMLALRDPQLGLFTAEEINLVIKLIRRFWEKNATGISLDSHDFLGWKLAAAGEDIPYEAALVSRVKPTDAARKRAAELEPLARECLSGNDG